MKIIKIIYNSDCRKFMYNYLKNGNKTVLTIPNYKLIINSEISDRTYFKTFFINNLDITCI